MHGISCCRLPIFKIENFDYGSQIKSLDFHLAPLQNLMSTLPYPHRHDFYQIDWAYEPTSFDLEWDRDGNVVQRFTPDS